MRSVVGGKHHHERGLGPSRSQSRRMRLKSDHERVPVPADAAERLVDPRAVVATERPVGMFSHGKGAQDTQGGTGSVSGRAIGGPCRNSRCSKAVPHEDEQEDGKGRHAATVRRVQHTDHGEHFFLGGKTKFARQ